MSHIAQRNWCKEIKEKYPSYFFEQRVLDVGSLDINGNNKELFEECEYVGLDVIEGDNVDVISVAHQYEPDELFNVVLSTNALEHDIHYELTIKKMIDLLKPKGFIFVSAGYKYKIHGTLKHGPENSGTSKMKRKWANYYKNLTIKDIINIVNFEEIFKEFYIGIAGKDLRFWGIKK